MFHLIDPRLLNAEKKDDPRILTGAVRLGEIEHEVSQSFIAGDYLEVGDCSVPSHIPSDLGANGQKT